MPSYKVEGIGYDFIPTVLHRDLCDHWVKIQDNESFDMARKLLKKEALLCGGTSGSNMAACFKFIKENNLQNDESLRFVVFCSDGLRNYMTKHLSDEWLVKGGFLEPNFFFDDDHPLAHMTAEKCNLKNIPHYDDRLTVSDALDCFKQGDSLIPLVENGKVKGVLTEDTLLKAVVGKKLTILASASKAMTKDFVLLPFDTDLSIIHRLLQKNPAV